MNDPSLQFCRPITTRQAICCQIKTNALDQGLHLCTKRNPWPDVKEALGVKIQVSPNKKTLLTKIVSRGYMMVKIASAPPEELGKIAKRVS